MAKLYFKYGAMGSSKSANALMTHYNYTERNKKALLIKSEVDTRDGAHTIKSRIGLSMECIQLKDFLSEEYVQILKSLDEKTEEEINQIKENYFNYDCVIVDEVQFANKEQIDLLSNIVDFLDIPVMCYGLRSDFKNELFEGSRRLLEIADNIEEIKTVCWCGKKATCNARYNEDSIIKDGEQIVLGANDKYISLCRKHYKLGQLTEKKAE